MNYFRACERVHEKRFFKLIKSVLCIVNFFKLCDNRQLKVERLDTFQILLYISLNWKFISKLQVKNQNQHTVYLLKIF